MPPCTGAPEDWPLFPNMVAFMDATTDNVPWIYAPCKQVCKETGLIDENLTEAVSEVERKEALSRHSSKQLEWTAPGNQVFRGSCPLQSTSWRMSLGAGPQRLWPLQHQRSAGDCKHWVRRAVAGCADQWSPNFLAPGTSFMEDTAFWLQDCISLLCVIWGYVYPPHPCICAQLSLTLCSPSGSSVYGSLQARILEWVAMPSPRGSSWPRNRTRVSSGSCIGRQMLCHWATWEAHLPHPKRRNTTKWHVRCVSKSTLTSLTLVLETGCSRAFTAQKPTKTTNRLDVRHPQQRFRSLTLWRQRGTKVTSGWQSSGMAPVDDRQTRRETWEAGWWSRGFRNPSAPFPGFY